MGKIERKFAAASGIFAFTLGSQCFAQQLATQSAMHARVQAIYSFSPSKVTNQVRENKSKEMDSFWNEVKGHPEVELPLLRNELADPGNPTFFFADGCDLLLSLSQSLEDQELAVRAFTRVDLADFESHQYLLEIHALAVKGANVTPAALHMLDDPKFQVFLPEHAYRLDQAQCLQVALLPLKTEVWLPSVLERLKAEHEDTAMRSLLLLLFYAQTDSADKAIAAIGKNLGTDAKVKDLAASIMNHEREIGVGKQPSRQRENQYREERRKRMKGVSDEAMDDMNELTEQIACTRAGGPLIDSTPATARVALLSSSCVILEERARSSAG